MTKKTPEDKIAAVKAEREKLDAKYKQEKARLLQRQQREQAKITNKKRKDDTRRKVLIGAAVQQLVNQGRWESDKVKRMMHSFLDKDEDRVLFDLPPKSASET